MKSLLVLFVLETSGRGVGVVAVPSSANEVTKPTGNSVFGALGDAQKIFTLITSLQKYMNAANLSDLQPHPMHSLEFLVKEALTTVQKLVSDSPQLLHDPGSFIMRRFPYVLALFLILLSFIPPLILPVKVASLLLSIMGLLDSYWSPFDENYLTNL
jgi:hypothetical protein